MNRRRIGVLFLLLLALFQIISAFRVLQLSENVSLLPPLEFVAGMLWAGVFVVVALRLLRRRGVGGVLLTLVAFALYSTLRLYIFACADYDRGRLPFLVGITGTLIFMIILFYRLRAGASTTEKRAHDG